MKAIVIYEPGGPEKLIYKEVPRPEIKPGWSLVRVMGAGINHSEIFTRKGLSPSVEFPRILGIECVGVIEETSDPISLPEGSKVISIMGEMGRDFDGGYAEYALLPNRQIHVVSTDLPWSMLAAIPETYYTAFGSMKNLRIDADDRILVRGGSSGVGVAFLRLLKAKCPEVFIAGSTRSMAKAEIMTKEGFDEVIAEQDGELQTEEQFDKVLELVGPATMKDTFLHVSEGGTVCSTGQLGGEWYLNGFDPITDLPSNGYLTSFYSDNVDGRKLQEMLDYIAKYDVNAAPEKIFSLKDVPEGHKYLESSRSFGKIVVLMDK